MSGKITSIEEILTSKLPVHEAMALLKKRGITHDQLVTGNFDRSRLAEFMAAAGGETDLGTDELGGLILVIEPDKDVVGSDGRPVRIYIVPKSDALELDPQKVAGAARWYGTGDITELIPHYLAEISVNLGKITVKPKDDPVPNPKDPRDNPIATGRKSSARRKNLVDAVLYQYLGEHRSTVAHMVQELEDLDDKSAIEGDDAIIERFAHGEALLAYGVTKVHTIESWLKEMLEVRLSRVRRDIRDFWLSDEGKGWTKNFLAQNFPIQYENVPHVLRWVLTNPVEGREPGFLLRALGAGHISPEESGRTKTVYLWWGRSIKEFGSAAEIDFVRESRFLTGQWRPDEVFYPLVGEFCRRRGVYSIAQYRAVMRGIYASGSLVGKDGNIISKQNVDRHFVTPGADIIANKVALDEIVVGVLETSNCAKDTDTTLTYVSRVIQDEKELGERIIGLTVQEGHLVKAPLSGARRDAALRKYINLEKRTNGLLTSFAPIGRDKTSYNWAKDRTS
jgi:hypothetical protein